jgi:nucleotide-binding universal stress UspA family protein
MTQTIEEQEATRCHRIVVGIDFSETSERALADAIEQASGHPRAELHVVTVANLDWIAGARNGAPAAKLDEVVAVERSAIEQALGRAGIDRGSVPTFVHVRVGGPAQEIVALAAEVDAHLIVVGTHGRSGWQRFWLGSVAERVLRLAHCPVLVTRPRQHPTDEAAPMPEPPCPQCVAVRAQSDGKQWWCEQHAHHHQRAHAYVYSSRFDSATTKVW